MDEKAPNITVMVKDNCIEINNAPGISINTETLNNALLTLPAKTYLGLFHKMHEGIYGYPPIANFGGCCGTVEGE